VGLEARGSLPKIGQRVVDPVEAAADIVAESLL
jgi:hypothetical protein